MLRFSDFDSRGYRTVDVRTGYGEWVATYEQTVQDVMDIALLDELIEPSWRAALGTLPQPSRIRRSGLAQAGGDRLWVMSRD